MMKLLNFLHLKQWYSICLKNCIFWLSVGSNFHKIFRIKKVKLTKFTQFFFWGREKKRVFSPTSIIINNTHLQLINSSWVCFFRGEKGLLLLFRFDWIFSLKFRAQKGRKSLNYYVSIVKYKLIKIKGKIWRGWISKGKDFVRKLPFT